MLESAISYTQVLVATYGVWGVFAGTILEEVVAPIPSALVPLAAGFFLLPSSAAFPAVALRALFVIALPVAVGITLGSSLVYVIAYYGGKPIIDRYGKLLGLTWGDVQNIEKKMTKGRKDEITLIVLRMVPIIPGVAVSGFCGALRYPFRVFAVITFFSSMIRAFAIGLIGWQAGEFYSEYLGQIDKYEKDILVVVVTLMLLAAFIHFARLHSKRKRRRTEARNDA